MNIICDFSVGFDNEIEDVSMYNEMSKELVTSLIEKLVHDKKIIVGERSEGTVYVNHDKKRLYRTGTMIKVEYRWCESLGEEEIDDVWNDEEFEIEI